MKSGASDEERSEANCSINCARILTHYKRTGASGEERSSIQ